MIFKTEKKEYEIIKFGMSYAGNHKSTTFKLVITKPFQAEAVFNADAIGQREKVDGIIFNEYSNIANALNTKKDVLFSLPPEALQFVHDTNAQEIESLRKTEEAKQITKWFWAVGGDSGDMYLANGNEIDTEFRPDISAIEKAIEKKAKQEAREKARIEIFAKAKYTEEKQILHQWSEECNDRNEECSLDNIVEYAMPDGSTKTERNHTW